MQSQDNDIIFLITVVREELFSTAIPIVCSRQLKVVGRGTVMGPFFSFSLNVGKV